VIINAKCAFEEIEQVKDRTMKKGIKDLEIQLLKNIHNMPEYEIKKILRETEANINIIHLRLYDGDSVNFSDFSLPLEEYFDKIYTGFIFAQKVADIQNNGRIGVVLHLDTGIKDTQNFMKNMIFMGRIKNLLENFPSTEILIENVMLVEENGYKNAPEGKGGCFYEPCAVAKMLNSYFKTDKFKTVLDICHAMSSIRISKELFNRNDTLDDFFREYKDTIGLIHLAWCEKYGYDNDHGLPFDKSRADILKEIMDLYDKYQYDCQITLEVYEDDFNDAKNCQETYRQLVKIIGLKED
jgi:hypothetical protein